MKTFASIAALVAGANALAGYSIETNPAVPVKLDAVAGDRTLATGSVSTTWTTTAAGQLDFNLIYEVNLTDAEWKRSDYAEIWICVDASAFGPPLFGCHLSKFITTKYNTEIQYEHYYTSFEPDIQDGEVPSIEFDRWERDDWPTWGLEHSDVTEWRASGQTANVGVHDAVERLNWYRGYKGQAVALYDPTEHLLLPESKWDKKSFQSRVWTFFPSPAAAQAVFPAKWGVYVDIDGVTASKTASTDF